MEILLQTFLEIFLLEFSGSLLALFIALFIFWLGIYHSKNKEKKDHEQMIKNLTLMIKDEIEFNREKNNQIRTEMKKGNYPNYRLKQDNKDACWMKIIEYRNKEVELIEEISKLYYKYELLNRTIDNGFNYMVNKIPVKGSPQEIIRITKKIEGTTKKILDRI